MARARDRGRAGGRRQYPRTARLNELCREILADELERLDDERLGLVTVTHVRVDPDLRRAVVEFTSLDDDEDTAAALVDHRVRLQAAIARQARLKRTPELVFRPDAVVRGGERIEEVLRTIEPVEAEGEPIADDADDADAAAPGADGEAS